MNVCECECVVCVYMCVDRLLSAGITGTYHTITQVPKLTSHLLESARTGITIVEDQSYSERVVPCRPKHGTQHISANREAKPLISAVPS